MKVYKNWTVHNIIGHPCMEILRLLGFKKAARKVHDGTLPAKAEKQ